MAQRSYLMVLTWDTHSKGIMITEKALLETGLFGDFGVNLEKKNDDEIRKRQDGF